MSLEVLIFLSFAIAVIAFMYSSVGHAGASGYIAVLSLMAFEPQTIKTTALVLNILVASIATWQFCRKGHFSWQLFWPFAILAVPMAFLGGYLSLPASVFKVIVGIVLIRSAVHFLTRRSVDLASRPPALSTSIPIGAGLGFLSGITGTGGGVFLTPLLLTMQWATAKQAASVSALFILANSVSGLGGNISSTGQLPNFTFVLAMVASLGGLAGSYFGSQRFDHDVIKRILSGVLLIAGSKMILTSLI